jgi:hypothetical protein
LHRSHSLRARFRRHRSVLHEMRAGNEEFAALARGNRR